ncbi:MAG: GlcG/HbpS family heme-binding protein [Motilibacteraceae bacterium]
MSTSVTTVVSASISAATAQQLIDAAIRAASDRGKAMIIAVVDSSGILKAFTRMDKAPLLSVEIAIDKAWTAAAYGIPTHAWRDFLDADAGVAQIAHRPRLTAFAGGFPLTVDGEVVGGLGISGGHYNEDREIAEAALTELGFAF